MCLHMPVSGLRRSGTFSIAGWWCSNHWRVLIGFPFFYCGVVRFQPLWVDCYIIFHNSWTLNVCMQAEESYSWCDRSVAVNVNKKSITIYKITKGCAQEKNSKNHVCSKMAHFMTSHHSIY